MSTSTTNAAKSYECTISCNGMQLTVRNNGTGRTMSADFARFPLGTAGRDLYHRLSDEGGVMDLVADVAHADLSLFRQIANYQAHTSKPATPAAIPPAPTPPAVAVAPHASSATPGAANGTASKVVARFTAMHGRQEADTTEVGDVRTAQRVVATFDERLWHFSYDIDERFKKDCPNPSAMLKRFGVRLNKSNWILPDSSLRSATVSALHDHWTTFGVEYDLIPQAAEATAQLRGIAVNRLDREIRRAHTALITRMGDATETFDKRITEEGLTPKELEAAADKRDNDHRSALRDTLRDLKSAIACAELFDATMEVAPLLEGLQAAYRAQTNVFNTKMRQRGRKPAETV